MGYFGSKATTGCVRRSWGFSLRTICISKPISVAVR